MLFCVTRKTESILAQERGVLDELLRQRIQAVRNPRMFFHELRFSVGRNIGAVEEFLPRLAARTNLVVRLGEKIAQVHAGEAGILANLLHEDFINDVRHLLAQRGEVRLIVFEASGDESRTELHLPVVCQQLSNVIVTLLTLDVLGIQIADALRVRERRSKETVDAIVGASSTRDDFTVRPVGRARVRAEAILERYADERVADEVVEEHTVDARTGETRVTHKVRGALFVAAESEDVSLIFAIQAHAHRAMIDVVRHGERRHRNF